ncbi:MAG: hypothetical protein KC505_06980 [Myxococcales bacterium]|nr:hypothetical protein [Myxococcales bacterium]USN50503.1 MAG: hypothetical protein H6731_09610 [Myxococcales bacterium]
MRNNIYKFIIFMFFAFVTVAMHPAEFMEGIELEEINEIGSEENEENTQQQPADIDCLYPLDTLKKIFSCFVDCVELYGSGNYANLNTY